MNNKEKNIILGIESSCDETGLALIDSERGLLGHIVHSQTELHQAYGGVVPELASRDHIRFFLPLLKQLLLQTGLTAQDITGIAYTQGPGLLGALLVGACFAHSLAKAWQTPLIGIHHLEGHLMAAFLEPKPPQPPFTALLVSGGHTMLIAVEKLGQYDILGESRDDAAGEAFDKTAKLLGLPYPGGAALSQLATQGRPHIFHFPRPMTDRPGLEFSFSGIKTAAVNQFLASDQSLQTKADIAQAFETAMVDTLMIKCERALKQTGHKTLVIAGGVSANQPFRNQAMLLCKQHQVQLVLPALEFCTDNAAMIAQAGLLRLQAGERTAYNTILARARWPLKELKGFS